jgi:hypothetical protein
MYGWKNDRIEVVASFDQPMAEHATLVVDQADMACVLVKNSRHGHHNRSEGRANGSGCSMALESRNGAARKESPPAECGRFGQATANGEAGLTIRNYLACAGGRARPETSRHGIMAQMPKASKSLRFMAHIQVNVGPTLGWEAL